MKGKMGKDCYKKGGAVKGKSSLADMKPKSEGGKRPHKVHGTSAKARLDKKARGGKIATPTSPLSGGAPKDIGADGAGAFGDKAPKGPFKLGSENN